MYALIYIFASIIRALVVKLLSLQTAKSTATPNALCRNCVHVHSVKGFNGREQIYCKYASDLRQVKFAVCECTGYCDKNAAPAARVAGFVRGEAISQSEAFPATVIRIKS